MKKLLIVFLAFLFSLSPMFFAQAAKTISVDDLGGIMFVGDSYCEGSNVKSDQKNMPELGWAQKSVDHLHLENYIIACLGGTGFRGSSSDDTTFQTLLDKYYPGEESAQSINWIIISGGYNDQYYSYDEIIAASEQFINHAHELYPNAQIAIGMNGWHATDTLIQEKLTNVVLKAYKDIADNKGLYYIEGSELALHGEMLFSADDFHPNPIGEEQIAYTIDDFINGIIHDMQIAQVIEKPENGINNIDVIAPLLMISIMVLSVVIVAIMSRCKANAQKNKPNRRRKH